MIDKANKMSNVLYSVLGRSCNRMLIGKTFWKGMALPYFLYGQEAILYNKGQIQKLQLTENKAFRTILQVGTSVYSNRSSKRRDRLILHGIQRHQEQNPIPTKYYEGNSKRTDQKNNNRRNQPDRNEMDKISKVIHEQDEIKHR